MTVLVLDLDGVLVGSKDAYAALVHDVLGRHGLRHDLEHVVATRVPHVGKWSAALVPADHPDREAFVRRLMLEVRDEMPARAMDLPVRESAREVLEHLASTHTLCLLTNSTSNFAHVVLDRIGLWGLFHRVVTSDDAYGEKHDAIARIAGEAGVPVSSLVYVGDTRGDVEAARRAGCRSVVVFTDWSWDPGPVEEVRASGPDALTECFADLPAVVEGLA